LEECTHFVADDGDAAYFLITMVYTWKATWCYNPEDENQKSNEINCIISIKAIEVYGIGCYGGKCSADGS
jgi:hypothetical protein